MKDNKTELQKKFEDQTPTIKGVTQIEYIQTFVTWLHLQLEREVIISNDLKKYIVDTYNHGVDSETLKSRAEQYKS